MSLVLHDAVQGIYGAWRLALLDRSGLAFFEQSPEGALRSFWAAVIVAPAYLVLLLLNPPADPGPLPGFLLVETIAYVVNWTAFALVMHHLTGVLDRKARYPGFLCAYNWSAIIQMAVYLPASTIAVSGLLPPGLGEILVVVVTLGVLSYQWFIARAVLDVPGTTAAGVVALDVVLSVFIRSYADTLLL